MGHPNSKLQQTNHGEFHGQSEAFEQDGSFPTQRVETREEIGARLETRLGTGTRTEKGAGTGTDKKIGIVRSHGQGNGQQKQQGYCKRCKMLDEDGNVKHCKNYNAKWFIRKWQNEVIKTFDSLSQMQALVNSGDFKDADLAGNMHGFLGFTQIHNLQKRAEIPKAVSVLKKVASLMGEQGKFLREEAEPKYTATPLTQVIAVVHNGNIADPEAHMEHLGFGPLILHQKREVQQVSSTYTAYIYEKKYAAVEANHVAVDAQPDPESHPDHETHPVAFDAQPDPEAHPVAVDAQPDPEAHPDHEAHPVAVDAQPETHPIDAHSSLNYQFFSEPPPSEGESNFGLMAAVLVGAQMWPSFCLMPQSMLPEQILDADGHWLRVVPFRFVMKRCRISCLLMKVIADAAVGVVLLLNMASFPKQALRAA
eukprot:gene20137-26867_t